MYYSLNECLCISLFVFLPFLFLIRSGTVHILHNNLPPALSQRWHSQHFALYYDFHFSHISPFSPQRHYWVPEHLFPTHGYMWVWWDNWRFMKWHIIKKKSKDHATGQLHPTNLNSATNDILMTIFPLFLSFWSVVGSTRREGGVPAYVNLSASSMLMIAMQYTSNPGILSHWLLLTRACKYNSRFNVA